MFLPIVIVICMRGYLNHNLLYVLYLVHAYIKVIYISL